MYSPYDNFVYGNMYRPQIQGARFVDGLAGAQSCVIPLGSKAILMDSNEDRFFIKETDFNGVSTISQYAFTKVEDKPADGDYVTREEFERWKENYESVTRQQPADSTLSRQSWVPADAGAGSPVSADHQDNAPRGPESGAAVSQGQFRFS